jgi:hypothetical protein
MTDWLFLGLCALEFVVAFACGFMLGVGGRR